MVHTNIGWLRCGGRGGGVHVCGTLTCEKASICEKVAKCENISTLNVKIDAMKNNSKCEKVGSLNL